MRIAIRPNEHTPYKEKNVEDLIPYELSSIYHSEDELYEIKRMNEVSIEFNVSLMELLHSKGLLSDDEVLSILAKTCKVDKLNLKILK